MKNVFVKTKNVKNFVTLMDKLQKLPPNIPKLALVYGEHGLGKTHSIMWWAVRNDAVYIRANNEITQNGLLKGIVEELGERPFYQMQENYSLILKHLKQEPKIIIVDEAEYLPYKALELLRRIYDKANVGVLLVGMPKLLKNLRGEKGQYTQLYSRVGIVKELNPLTKEDGLAIVSSVTPNTSIYPQISTYCGSNTRVLTKLLVRALRIAKLNDIEVNEDAINLSLSQLLWSK